MVRIFAIPAEREVGDLPVARLMVIYHHNTRRKGGHRGLAASLARQRVRVLLATLEQPHLFPGERRPPDRVPSQGVLRALGAARGVDPATGKELRRARYVDCAPIAKPLASARAPRRGQSDSTSTSS